MSIMNCEKCGKKLDTDYIEMFEIGDGSQICEGCFEEYEKELKELKENT